MTSRIPGCYSSQQLLLCNHNKYFFIHEFARLLVAGGRSKYKKEFVGPADFYA